MLERAAGKLRGWIHQISEILCFRGALAGLDYYPDKSSRGIGASGLGKKPLPTENEAVMCCVALGIKRRCTHVYPGPTVIPIRRRS